MAEYNPWELDQIINDDSGNIFGKFQKNRPQIDEEPQVETVYYDDPPAQQEPAYKPEPINQMPIKRSDILSISGVGNRMMIDDPERKTIIDEFGQEVEPDTVRRIQSYLEPMSSDDSEMPEEDRSFFGLKQPNSDELMAFEQWQKFSNYVAPIIEEKANKAREDAINRFESVFYKTDFSVMTPAQKAAYNQQKHSTGEAAYNTAKQREWDSARKVADMATAKKLQSERATTNPYAPGDKAFEFWDPKDKDTAVKRKILLNESPQFGSRDSRGKAAFDEHLNAFMRKNGISTSEMGRIRSNYKGLSTSLSQQEKRKGSMGNFVININKQAERAEQLFEYLKRTDVQALNKPIRLLRSRFIGSGLEGVYEMFTKEISAEASKLSQGSEASIAQLPEGNREEWERVHSLDRPISEQRFVFNGTKELANMRYASVEEQIAKTKQEMDGLLDKYENKQTGETPQPGAPQPGMVSKGYRFKGGNPADKNNWEKI